MTEKTQPTAFDAWEAYKAAIDKASALKKPRDAEFDRFLETSDRPITLRDLMFALAVIDRIAFTCLRRFEEILDKVPEEKRIWDREETFGTMEHSNLRDQLFELYFSHAAVKLDEKFWDAYSPWQDADQLETRAKRAYHQAREREGLLPGEVPENPSY